MYLILILFINLYKGNLDITFLYQFKFKSHRVHTKKIKMFECQLCHSNQDQDYKQHVKNCPEFQLRYPWIGNMIGKTNCPIDIKFYKCPFFSTCTNKYSAKIDVEKHLINGHNIPKDTLKTMLEQGLIKILQGTFQ